jgi:hypothetical protein
MGAGGGLLVGAENAIGKGAMTKNVVPATDVRIVSSAPVPGQSASYSVVVKGVKSGGGVVTTTMTASRVPGKTIVRDGIQVRAG